MAQLSLGLLAAGVVAGLAAAVWWRQRRKLQETQAQLDEFLRHWRGRSSGSTRQGGEMPANLVCVITGEPFEDPVMCADGHTYERAAIEDWFARGHSTSPLTNVPLRHKELTPNHAVRGAVENFA
eukprot:gnl/TRDRNA2_/TRDRNA2_149780_c0_seq1.p2 gnl/TRDRNA2_/TRDRNA2_149780_c0~~gnl/TRDRNA2_/TRDRNA2_149780_c0_seq1.p2  ORF type:complete len:125 (+),score=16.77 gnl/TRDRNA2_/TRDRNA2_149780_c0_seq1:412-786(+)